MRVILFVLKNPILVLPLVVRLFLREQAEKAKGNEPCSGLDEAGNYLGDISLGFFLRQVCPSGSSNL